MTGRAVDDRLAVLAQLALAWTILDIPEMAGQIIDLEAGRWSISELEARRLRGPIGHLDQVPPKYRQP